MSGTPAPDGSGDRGSRVVVVGSANADLTATTTSLPRAGETVLGTGFTTGRGGKGANQAVAAARAGGRVQLIGAVGTDQFAELLRGGLRDDDVDVVLLRSLEGPSGVALITVDGAGENTIVVVPGANGELGSLTSDDRAAIEQSDAVLSQLEVPVDTVTAAAAAAHRAGKPFLLNMSPIMTLPAELIDHVTVALVNENEAEAFSAQLTNVPHVVVTLGAKGARYAGHFGELSVPAPEVQPVDTVGAGDAFAGTLAAHWISATDAAGLESVLRRACAAGALATTVRGASDAAPRSDAVQELLATRWWVAQE